MCYALEMYNSKYWTTVFIFYTLVQFNCYTATHHKIRASDNQILFETGFVLYFFESLTYRNCFFLISFRTNGIPSKFNMFSGMQLFFRVLSKPDNHVQKRKYTRPIFIIYFSGMLHNWVTAIGLNDSSIIAIKFLTAISSFKIIITLLNFSENFSNIISMPYNQNFFGRGRVPMWQSQSPYGMFRPICPPGGIEKIFSISRFLTGNVEGGGFELRTKKYTKKNLCGHRLIVSSILVSCKWFHKILNGEC